MTCSYCGERIDGKSAIEPVIPIDVLWWGAVHCPDLDIRSVKHDMQYGRWNKLYVHPECVEKRPAYIPDIASLRMNQNKLSTTKFYLARTKTLLTSFSEIRQKVLEANGGKCSCCNGQTEPSQTTLIRANDKFGYTESNARVVCLACSRTMAGGKT